MKKLIYLASIVLISMSAFSQFPANLKVNSDGTISNSPTTVEGKRYRITVEGTYSMWPQFTDCRGVDAAYVYEVPQEEIDAYRWPPQVIQLGPVSIPFVEIPHWVGDSKVWQFPPKEIATPLFEMSFRDHKGFRIDKEPLPNTGLNMAAHRYQIEKMGTGRPFEFQILDSNYNILLEKMLPRYEDNCGQLTVKIEDLDPITDDINICDIKPICQNGQYVGVKLMAALFQADTNSVTGKKNILSSIPLNQIGIVEDGKFICGIDSIVCDSRSTPISVGLLLDRSGSMNGPFVEGESTVRMVSAKTAMNSFIDKLTNSDSAFVVSFGNDTRLDIDWTNNKALLKNTIDTITPGGQTAFHQALLMSLEKIAKSSNPRRALIIISDGANNKEPYWNESILRQAQTTNVPIYLTALGFSNNSASAEDSLGRMQMKMLSEASRGKFYDVRTAPKLDTIYKQLTSDIVNDECCALYFKTDPCSVKTERFIRIIYTPSDTTILTKVVNFICDTCDSNPTGHVNIGKYENNGVDVNPNPFDAEATLEYQLSTDGNVNIAIYNISGEKIANVYDGYQNLGKQTFKLNAKNIESGTYLVAVTQSGLQITKKIIIIH